MLVKKNHNQFIFWITASCLIFTLAVILFTPFSVTQAADPGSEAMRNLDTVAAQTTLQKSDPKQVIGRLIRIFLGFLGIIGVIIVLYAGYIYMTSGGDPDKIKTSKAWLINGTIGLIIIFASYSIISFIINAIKENVDPNYNIASTIPGGLNYNLSGGAFGEIMSGHAPGPEQTDVPRNTMILVTFKLPIDPLSFIDLTAPDVSATGVVGYDVCPDALAKCKSGNCPDTASVCGPVNINNFKTFQCRYLQNWPVTNPAKELSDCLTLSPVGQDPTSNIVTGYVMITQDRRTVVFNPFGNGTTDADYLGSSAEDVSYIVHLTSGLAKKEPANTPVFSDANGYYWRFTTGTFVDLTPPKVNLTIPKDQVGLAPYEVIDGSLDKGTPRKVFRNQIIVANFNEPVLPLFSTDQTGCGSDSSISFNEAQLLLSDDLKTTKADGNPCTTSHVPGKWVTGLNQYKTIQFVSSMKCEGVDKNSCGESVFCLPKNKDYDGLIKGATIDESGFAEFGTGIVDLAGNSLDGGGVGCVGNGTAENSPTDDCEWSSVVGNSDDLDPPIINNLTPKNAEESINKSGAVTATFNKGLDADSVDNQVFLYGTDFSGWFDANLNGTDNDIVTISHGQFTQVEEGQEGPLYMPIIKSKVRDLHQNCFTPSRNTGEDATSSSQNTNTGTDCSTGITSNLYGTSCCPNEASTNKYEATRGTGVCSWTDIDR